MAIDYFGHSTRSIEDAGRLIAAARAAHPEWFDVLLLLYDPRPLDGPFDREIARDFGQPEARSRFMLSLNDKDRGLAVLEAALDYLYGLFGPETLVLTHGLDQVRPP